MAVRMPDPYALADETIGALNSIAIGRVTKYKNALAVSGFDELTVLQQTKTLYRNLDSDNRKRFKRLFVDHYTEMLLFLKGKKSGAETGTEGGISEDAVEEIAVAALAGLLEEPNAITGYRYDTEVKRKRDRAEESIIAASGRTNKEAEINKALRFWSQMTGQYADSTSDEAGLQAMKDSGVKYVKWHTQEDGKVCAECKRRNGKIYRIDRIPGKPHWRCRCYWTPVSGGGT